MVLNLYFYLHCFFPLYFIFQKVYLLELFWNWKNLTQTTCEGAFKNESRSSLVIFLYSLFKLNEWYFKFMYIISNTLDLCCLSWFVLHHGCENFDSFINLSIFKSIITCIELVARERVSCKWNLMGNLLQLRSWKAIKLN